jgi:hypothetical protein
MSQITRSETIVMRRSAQDVAQPSQTRLVCPSSVQRTDHIGDGQLMPACQWSTNNWANPIVVLFETTLSTLYRGAHQLTPLTELNAIDAADWEHSALRGYDRLCWHHHCRRHAQQRAL